MASKGTSSEDWKECNICKPKKNFTSKANSEEHFKSKKHQKSLEVHENKRKAKINLRKIDGDFAIKELKKYFPEKGFGEIEYITSKKYDTGDGFLLLTVESIDTLQRLVRTNPHTITTCTPNWTWSIIPLDKSIQLDTLGTSSESKPDYKSLPLTSCSSLKDQLALLYKKLSLSSEDKDFRKKFIDSLQKTCKKNPEFKGCIIHPFGSSNNHLGAKGSDLDLVVLTNGDYQQKWEQPLPDTLSLLETLRKLLFKRQLELSIRNTVALRTARIPVLKIFRTKIPTNCDVSFNKRMSILNTKLIGAIMECSEKAKHITFAILQWGKLQYFAESGGVKLNSYTIILMVIFYLQHINALPPLINLKNESNTIKDSTDVEGFCVEPSDFCDLDLKLSKFSEEYILKEFIEFYLRFPFTKSIISVLHGKPLLLSENKDMFSEANMYVQDPFEIRYNTARRVSLKVLVFFRRCLITARMDSHLIQSSSSVTWGLPRLLNIVDEKFCIENKSLRFFSVEIPQLRMDKQLAYINACTYICRKLKKRFLMDLQPLKYDHVIVKDCVEFLYPTAEDCKRPRLDSNDPSCPGTSMATEGIPLGYYVPCNFYIKSKYNVFAPCEYIQDQSKFNYKVYTNWVKERIKSTQSKPDCIKFEISMEPEDSDLDTVRILFANFNSKSSEHAFNHLKVFIPSAVEHYHNKMLQPHSFIEINA